MKFYYLFKYYFLIILTSIILLSNNYKKKFFFNNSNIEIINPTYKDYIFWKELKKNNTINIPLSINTFYNNNFIKKENFQFLSFSNINKKKYKNISVIPNIFISYKNFLSKKDISYFNVKTPTTQLFYNNSINKNLLKTIFTQNTKKNINYSIHYNYLYPKNKYQNNLLSINYFLTTFNYNNIENKYYKIWIHFINHSINNKYNHIKIPFFLDKNLNKILNIQRYYIGQYFQLYKNIFLLNRLEYEKKIFIYKEKKYENIFGNVYINEPRENKIYYNKISNEFNIKYFFNKKIFLLSGIGYYHLEYFPIKNNIINIISKNYIFSYINNIEYNYFNKLKINLFGKYLLINNNYKNNIYYIFFKTKYNTSFNSKIEGRLIFYNIYPYFNIISNKSFYKKYNYFNYFNNIQTQQLYFNFLKKNINIYFNIYNIKNYIYFSFKEKPKQYKNILKIYNISFYNFFSLKKIKFNYFIKIQNTNFENNIFKIPKLITKSCFFYEKFLFRKKILFQTGFIFKYFTKYFFKSSRTKFNNFIKNSLSENDSTQEIPYLDYFINIEFFRIKVYFLIYNFKFYNFYKNIYSYNKIPIKIGLLWNLFT